MYVVWFPVSICPIHAHYESENIYKQHMKLQTVMQLRITPLQLTGHGSMHYSFIQVKMFAWNWVYMNKPKTRLFLSKWATEKQDT